MINTTHACALSVELELGGNSFSLAHDQLQVEAAGLALSKTSLKTTTCVLSNKFNIIC